MGAPQVVTFLVEMEHRRMKVYSAGTFLGYQACHNFSAVNDLHISLSSVPSCFRGILIDSFFMFCYFRVNWFCYFRVNWFISWTGNWLDASEDTFTAQAAFAINLVQHCVISFCPVFSCYFLINFIFRGPRLLQINESHDQKLLWYIYVDFLRRMFIE